MGRRRKPILMEADEDMVKRLARIVGPMSAAQNAIDKAAEYMAQGLTVKYWFSDDNHIVVEGIPPEQMRDTHDAASCEQGEKK